MHWKPVKRVQIGNLKLKWFCTRQTGLEKQNKALYGDIADKTQQLDDLHTSLAEADITKKKLSVEKSDLEKQIDEADKTLRALGKMKSSLSTQVNDI